jgi:hypothetical protein
LLRLYQPPKEGELGGLPVLFAVCPVRLGDGRYMQHYVEHVMDSSRYFVLRCEVRACQIAAFYSAVINAFLSIAAQSTAARLLRVSEGFAHQLQQYGQLLASYVSCMFAACLSTLLCTI